MAFVKSNSQQMKDCTSAYHRTTGYLIGAPDSHFTGFDIRFLH